MKRKSRTEQNKSPKDSLVVKAAEKGDVELKDDELKRVSGGLIGLLDKQK
jgi:hypothetical protein